MARPKKLSDKAVLSAALSLMHAGGPDALTFAALAQASSLSPATLVQRFATMADLKRAALQQAWDGLDEKTAALADAAPKTPAGAIGLLVGLSRNYGGIEAYAEGLLVLREDLRDPVLRARGARWKAALGEALGHCFANRSTPEDIGFLMAAQWQGCLLWWSFEPVGPVEQHVEKSLRRFVAAVLGAQPA